MTLKQNEWYQANKERINNKRRERYNNDSNYRERMLEQQRKYSNTHREQRLNYSIGYRVKYPDRVKESKKKDRIRNKDRISNTLHQWYLRNKEHVRNYQNNHREQILLSAKKTKARRKRDLGFNILFDNPFPDETYVVVHHISDGFVVYLPESLHYNHYGKNHREDLKPYVEGIYNISYLVNEKS